jgi:hypothetical protein
MESQVSLPFFSANRLKNVYRMVKKNSIHAERRSGVDRRRRRFTIETLFRYGKRKEVRRQEDTYKIFFVDQYSATIFTAIVLILFFSVIDALLTLILIDHGAREMNPLMAYILRVEPGIFLIVKYLLTTTSLFILLVFRNIFIKKIKIYTRTLFSIIICLFVSVIAWELFLMYQVGLFTNK